MSNDFSRVYQFLAKQGENNAWVAKADANGDNVVTKSEFRNFMNENFEWNGETDSSKKNDLINNFWKEIDTVVSGKVKGTKIKNKGALDETEINKMEEKIKLYEALNNYTSGIIVPQFINNRGNWLKSVTESLSNLVKNEYKGKPEDLEDWLDSENRAASSMSKATADYCANEYIAEVMADAVKNYGYAYGDDSTLKGMIDNYIQKHLDGYDPDSIQETVRGIIDSYMSTAQLNRSRGGIAVLKDYGYNPSADSPLNDLQKSMIKTKLEKAITSGTLAEKYKSYKEMFDTAMKTFLDGLKYGNFTKVNNNVLQEFQNSDAYKKIDKAIQAKEVFKGSALKSRLKDEIGGTIGDRISNVMVGELPAFDKIVEEAMSKAQNGEFDTNEKLDTQKLINWIVGEIKANLADFYPNGLSDMSLEELGKTYDTLVKSAKEKQDAQKVKDAAISYCKAVSSKSDALAQAVIEVFETDNYAAKINKLTTGEIETKMKELKKKVDSIGDVTKMTTNEKNALFRDIKSSSYTLYLGEAKSFNIPRTATCNGKVITSNRIQYDASGCLSVDANGKVTINTANAGTHQGTITVIIDGTKVSSKTITVTIENKYKGSSIANSLKGTGNDSAWGGASEHLEILRCSGVEDWTQVTSANFSDLYNNNAIIQLHNKWGTDGKYYEFGDYAIVRSRVKELTSFIGTALENAGLDKSKLDTAIQKVEQRLMDTGTWSAHKDAFGCDRRYYCSDRIRSGTYPSNTVVKQQDDRCGTDWIVYMISFKGLVDLILEEYNKLI